MSSLAVTVERLTIHPHDNADALELAQVGEYRAVVGKGSYQTGDFALYIPEQAILPEALIEELGLVGRLAGKKKDRIKAIRLRGELSQGIVCRPGALSDVDWEAAASAGTDFADRLGITKWVPEIPASMNGEIAAEERIIPWIDIENIARYPELFATGEEVRATEKAHGTACIIGYLADEDRVVVSSKGFSRQRLALVEDSKVLYWRAVRHHGLVELLGALADELGAKRIGLFGEVFGRGVQDLHYGVASINEPGFAAFDLAVDDGTGPVRFVDTDEMRARLEGRCPLVPLVYSGPYDWEALYELASGPETISGTEAHLREGVVVRSAIERYSPIVGGRAIGKIVSGDYLTRHGGTEYE